jgi:hypothetical protein
MMKGDWNLIRGWDRGMWPWGRETYQEHFAIEIWLDIAHAQNSEDKKEIDIYSVDTESKNLVLGLDKSYYITQFTNL